MILDILSWNLKNSSVRSESWNIIKKLNPDIALLQEVREIPLEIKRNYSIVFQKATKKNGGKQNFGTAILSRYPLYTDLPFESEYEWVNKELEIFKGNLVTSKITVGDLGELNVVSVYSPAWKIDPERLIGIDIDVIKLKNNPDLWVTELIWAALSKSMKRNKENWIVAGDFNSSVTFDYMWGSKPRGNQEFIDRMNSLGLMESVFEYHKKHVPTFKNTNGGKVIHQMDHMYLSKNLFAGLIKTEVKNDIGIFENSISDHLPIISQIELT